MTTTQVTPPQPQIGDLLESAVILSWNELLKSSPPGLVHVEYGTAQEPSLQYVKIWLATSRGAWNLICEYWMSSGFKNVPPAGLTFSNGFHSAALAEIFEATMHARQGFMGLLSGDSCVSLIVVHSPTKEQLQNAHDCITEAYQRFGLVYAAAAGKMAVQ